MPKTVKPVGAKDTRKTGSRSVGDTLRAHSGYLLYSAHPDKREHESDVQQPREYFIKRVQVSEDRIETIAHDTEERRALLDRLALANQVRKSGVRKRHGAKARKAQIARAMSRLRNACKARDVHLIYVFTLK